jgi:regulator of sigma D
VTQPKPISPVSALKRTLANSDREREVNFCPPLLGKDQWRGGNTLIRVWRHVRLHLICIGQAVRPVKTIYNSYELCEK